MYNIKNISDIETIVLLSIELGFSFNGEEGILLGYDLDCHKPTGCSGYYYNLDGSGVLNGISNDYLRGIGKNFNSIKGNELLMLVNGQIKSVSMNEAHVNAVACQTIHEFKGMVIDCKQTFKDLDAINANLI